MARPSCDKSKLISALKEHVTASDQARLQHRLHCVLMVAAGLSFNEVAQSVGMSARTVERWAQNYERFGVAGLADDKKTGRLSKLSFNQLRALRSDLRVNPQCLGYQQAEWTGRNLAEHILDKFAVRLSIRQCQRLLRQLQQHDAPTHRAGVTASTG